jgi:DNA/RNA endonuclease YhcR with UshA esterase domain
MLAGLRLAAILNRLFASLPAEIDQSDLKSKYKNLIPAENSISYLGKKVTVCDKVYSVRYTNTITQISVGGKYPNNPITVIIFSKSYPNFKGVIEDMFKDKNICVKGKVEEYRGKAQIIIEKPEDIVLL